MGEAGRGGWDFVVRGPGFTRACHALATAPHHPPPTGKQKSCSSAALWARHLLVVLAQPGVRVVVTAVGLGHGHARAAVVGAKTRPTAGLPAGAGALAPHHEPDHDGADVRGGTRPLRNGSGVGRAAVRGLRGHLRARLVRLRNRPDRHPARAGSPVPGGSPGAAVLRPAPHRSEHLATAAPVRDRRLRAERVAHAAVRDQRLVRGMAAYRSCGCCNLRSRSCCCCVCCGPHGGPSGWTRQEDVRVRHGRSGRRGRQDGSPSGPSSGLSSWRRPAAPADGTVRPSRPRRFRTPMRRNDGLIRAGRTTTGRG